MDQEVSCATRTHTVTQLTTRFRTMPKMCLISVGVQVAFPSRSREDVHVISNKIFWRTLLYRKSISLLGYSPNFLLFTGKRALCVSQIRTGQKYVGNPNKHMDWVESDGAAEPNF